MNLVVVEPPASPVFTWEEAKERLRIRSDADEEVVMMMIAAATQVLDGPEGRLGRCLVEQTLELRMNCFPAGEILLPCPPVASIAAVAYTDGNGADQQMAPGTFRLIGGGTNWRAAPAYGGSWPSARHDHDAVRIRYVAGYGDPDDVPDRVRAAILMMAGKRYRAVQSDPTLRRESIEGSGTWEWDNTGAMAKVLDDTVMDLIQDFVVYA